MRSLDPHSQGIFGQRSDTSGSVVPLRNVQWFSADAKARFLGWPTGKVSHVGPSGGVDEASDSNAPEMKVAETPEERASAFRLVHDVYSEAGLIPSAPTGMRVMQHHLADGTEVLIAKRQGQVRFTVSLVRDAEFGLPLDSLFADEVDQMRADGIRLAEVSCLACDGESSNKQQRFEMLVKMISLTLQTARRRGVERLLLAVHPRHAKVYQRLFGCVPCSDVKQYAAVQGNPAVLCMHDFKHLDRTGYPLYHQIYHPRYAPWQMDGSRMTDAEKRSIEQALSATTEAFVPMAA